MLPAHLRKYVVEQDYSRYTPVDQAVWRYIMRQLTDYLSEHAHPCYIEGLKRTGIDVDRIPEISRMSEKLEKYGWKAVPVSGFIPPAAFMELQAYGYLPIASDLRTIDHIMYTPAPDIVHEAAGHAPILIEPEFAAYLKSYAQVARKAIISREDMEQYEAIRVLSDLKEDPSSTPEQIEAANRKLADITAAMSDISEAALLGRMNWWTAEYGLIGSLEDPHIFGAGLLSSVGESKACLDSKVKKLPLTIECIDYSYDITEQQPQLFVTPSFAHLQVVLEQFAERMSFRRGGRYGLERAQRAATVNTVQLDSGLQVSGKLKSFSAAGERIDYIQFDGPCQLSYGDKELEGHGRTYHAQGFGSPLGLLEGDVDLESLDLRIGADSELRFRSGVVVRGKLKSLLRTPNQKKLLVVAFDACTVTHGTSVLFQPEWGVFDMAVGHRVSSVFGGPADRMTFGETEDFVAKTIPRKSWDAITKYKHSLYAEVRSIREDLENGSLKADEAASDRLEKVYSKVEADLPHDWLLRLEILELSHRLPSDSWRQRLQLELKNLSSDSTAKKFIEDGIRVFR
ncbi:MAG TPA: aromatic amino acid hydroxylase [Bdellovibrionales bacterium]|nr:aromatic amino acid hydroxylase [Bdellovibrionales bacterium]